ncbi:29861_t:CDS:2, partial [Gigaspora margarita]
MTRSFFSEVSEASEDYATEVDEINDFNFISDVDEATLINGVYEATDLKEVTLATESIKVTENIESTDSPKHWPSRKKCWILFVLTITGTLIITTGSILFPAFKKLRKEFDTSENLATVNTVLTAIQACGSSSTVSVGAGIISDIYFPKDRGFAFGIFSLAPATLIGTASGGYIIEYLDWRWIYYSLAIYAPSTIGLLFLAPTLGNSFGSAIGGKCSDFILQIARKNGVEIICPEMRIKSATIGALMVPYVFGTYIVYNSLSPYLIDVCPGLSASAIALSYCIRLIMTGVVAIFGSLMEDSLGT